MQDHTLRNDRSEESQTASTTLPKLLTSSSSTKSADRKTVSNKHKHMHMHKTETETKTKTTPHLLPSTKSAAKLKREYDADQLLVSRTTKHSSSSGSRRQHKRRRSNSDSALYPRSSSSALKSLDNSRKTHARDFDFDFGFNFNALSKPIDIDIGSSTQKRKQSQSQQVKDMTVLHTMSSLVQDMNVDHSYKNVFIPSAQPTSPPLPSTMFASACSIENILEKQRSKHRNENNGTADFSDIADLKHQPLKPKQQQRTLRTSHSSKTMEFAHIADPTTTTSTRDETRPCSNSDDYVLRPLPLRRSRTVTSLFNLLSPAHDHHHILSLSHRPCFGFDIGGTLTKISFFEPARHAGWNVYDAGKTKFVTSSCVYGSSGIRDKKLSFPWRNGTFHFIHFQTDRMSEAVALLNKEENLLANNEVFYATGGGAHKYGKFLARQLHVNVRKGDELKCLISGLNFLLTHVSDEVFYLSDPASKRPSKHIAFDIQTEGSVFPYLLVNVGSGVSILKVCSPTQFERVSGTQIGGGTYWGLCRLCAYSVLQTSPHTLTFKKAFELAMKGNAKKVNMLVSDIYGGDYPQCNLPGDLVASAFGKCISLKNPSQDLTVGDIARGLLDAIAMNCAQLAYLNAVRFKITRIIFAGNFLRQNDLSMAMISYAIHYWSQGVMKACFLKHEGYCGSIGVMLLPDDELQDEENVDVNEAKHANENDKQ